MLRFGSFDFDLETGELWRQGRRVRLSPQPSRVLAELLRRPGELVTKDEIRRSLWPDGTVVEFEPAIAAAISQVRAALRDVPSAPRYVETSPRRGYRFVAPVERVPDRQAAAAVEFPIGRGRGKRRVFVVGALGVAAAIVAIVYFAAASTRSSPARIAILPVRHAASEPELAAPSELLAESFTSALARAGGPRVSILSPLATSAFPEQWRRSDMRRLPADFVVDCSLRRVDEAVRVHAKLARSKDFWIVWIRDFDLPLSELARRQDELVRQIGVSMVREIDHSRSARGEPLPGSAGYLEWLSARHRLTEGNPVAAAERFREAIRAGAGQAGVHAALAEALLVSIRMGAESRATALPEATEAARRAMAIDPSLPQTRTALGGVLWLKHRPLVAQRFLRAALQDDPNDALAGTWLAAVLASSGDRGEAFCQADAALAREPTWLYLLREIQFQGLTDITS